MPETNIKPGQKSLLLLIIFLAGFSFLIYEVSWNRFLSHILGTTVTASTIVLMAVMAGFGAGAWFLGNKANRQKYPGKLLGAILVGLGIFSLVNYFIIGGLTSALFGTFESAATADAVFFAITFVLLCIPAFMMGGVIPLVSKMLILNNKGVAGKFGGLYAFETLGSTMGGLFTGFIFLGNMGQEGTMFLASALALLNGGMAFIVFNRFEVPVTEGNTEEKQRSKIAVDTQNYRHIALVSTFIFGIAVLSLQLIWIRIFKVYFTNTSYTFTVITSFVIMGLFFGSLTFRRYGDKIILHARAMYRALFIFVGLAFLGLIFSVKLPEIFLFPFGESITNPYVRLIVAPFLASFFIVMPPSLVSGFAFPLACRMFTLGHANVSKNVGKILFFNTLGSVLGPALATFALIPLLGASRAIISVIFIAVLLTAIMSAKDKTRKKLRQGLMVGSMVLLGIILLMEPIMILPPSFKKLDRKILFYDETVEGTIVVGEDPGRGFFRKSSFVNNSAVIGSNYDAIKAVKLVGHLPFFAGLEAKNVLVVGFGIGVTTSVIASHPSVGHIDCVELVPGLTEASKHYFAFNKNVANDPRLNMIPGDGRHFLQMTAKKYDMITCDPTHPVLGSGNLYTKDYFEQCRDHLSDGGMVSQYLPIHKLRLQDLQGLIKTFHSVFPNSSLWLGQYHAVLFGRNDHQKIDFGQWKEIVEAQPQDEFFYLQPYHNAACMILDSAAIAALPQDVRINTDDLSYTEFFDFDCFKEENLPKNLKFLNDSRADISSVFENIDDAQKMQEFINGNTLLNGSLYYQHSGEPQKAINKLREAIRANPEDQEFPFLMKFVYGVGR